MAGGAAAATGTAQAAIDGCTVSTAAKFVPAAQLESSAKQQYAQLRAESSQKRALAPDNHPQMVRLRAIAERIIPYARECNARAAEWQWEVSLIGSRELNAFCMPGGKIAFYFGILEQLQLSDDEVAVVMGHEVAHALLEHARERVGKTTATRGVIEIGSALLGLGDLGRMAVGVGAQLLTLKFSRSDESEADHVGLELSARAGYNPGAGVTLWQKMLAASKGAPPQWMSDPSVRQHTHPGHGGAAPTGPSDLCPGQQARHSLQPASQGVTPVASAAMSARPCQAVKPTGALARSPAHRQPAAGDVQRGTVEAEIAACKQVLHQAADHLS